MAHYPVSDISQYTTLKGTMHTIFVFLVEQNGQDASVIYRYGLWKYARDHDHPVAAPLVTCVSS